MDLYNVLGSIRAIIASEKEYSAWFNEHTTNARIAGATSMKVLKVSDDSYYFTYQFPDEKWPSMKECLEHDLYSNKLKGKGQVSAIDTPNRWLTFFEEGANEANVEENSSTRFSVKLDFLNKMETVF